MVIRSGKKWNISIFKSSEVTFCNSVFLKYKLHLHNFMRPFHLLIAIGIAFMFSSCISGKETNLLQGISARKNQPVSIANKAPQYRLQPNDVLSIKIKTLNEDDSKHLSLQPDNVMNVNEVSTFLNGYSVTDSGYINMPSIGHVQVAGLTIEEARKRIQRLIRSSRLRDASVFVYLVSFRVSITGDVKIPGQYYVYNNQLTILEAIARSGGFLEFADRENVQLIRQTAEGSEIVLVDLTDGNLLFSPYYYLRPNDIINVNNLEQKNKRSNLSNLTIVNSVIGTISATIAILTFVETRRRLREE